MSGIVTVQKIEKWARIPAKSSEFSNGNTFQNAYTTSIQKGEASEVSSGIVFSDSAPTVALILGKSPSPKNKNLQIRKNFIGLKGELAVSITNCSDDVVELDPFTHLTDFVFLKASGGDPNIVDSLDSTERGYKGFGSTGLN